jgi:hypothetical protein
MISHHRHSPTRHHLIDLFDDFRITGLLLARRAAYGLVGERPSSPLSEAPPSAQSGHQRQSVGPFPCKRWGALDHPSG